MEEQWNNPDRSDYYLMSIANEVRRVLAQSKDKNKFKITDCKLPFDRKTNKPIPKKSPEELAAISKARWSSAYGVRIPTNE